MSPVAGDIELYGHIGVCVVVGVRRDDACVDVADAVAVTVDVTGVVDVCVVLVVDDVVVAVVVGGAVLMMRMLVLLLLWLLMVARCWCRC